MFASNLSESPRKESKRLILYLNRMQWHKQKIANKREKL